MKNQLQKNWAFVFVFLALSWLGARLMWGLQNLTIPWDSKNQFYPMLRFLANEIEEGSIPLWNPFHYAGHPTVADPQSFLFNPTVSFLAFFNKSPSLFAFDTLIMAHLLVGAFGLVLFARREHLKTPSALIMALVYMFGGVASARLQHSMMIISYGLFPWCMLFLMRLVRDAKLIHAVVFGVLGGLIALGRDQVAFLFGLTMLAFCLHELLGHREKILKKMLLLGLSLTLTLAILSAPALLTLEFLSLSNRPVIGIETALSASLSPYNFATLIGADIFGSVSGKYIGPGPDSLGNGEWTDATINYLFFGSAPLVFLLVYGLKSPTRTQKFFIGALVVSTLYALGRHTPFFALMYDYLPGINLYRRPADASFVMNFALAIVAGFSVQCWLTEPQHSKRALYFAYAFIAAVGLFAIGFVAFTTQQNGQVLRALLTPIASFGLLYFILNLKNRTNAAFAAVCFTALELVVFNAGNAMNGQPKSDYQVLESLNEAQKQIIETIDEPAGPTLVGNMRPRVEFFALPGPWQNISMIYSVPAATGYNALRIDNFQKFTGIAQNPIDPNQRAFPGTFTGFSSPMANMLGIKYVLTGKPIDQLPYEIRHAKAKLIFQKESYWLYELPDPLPRAYLAQSAVTIDDEVLEKSNAPLPAFHLRGQVLVDNNATLNWVPLARPSVEAYPQQNGNVQIIKYSNNEIVIEVENTKPAMLVLHDMMYPGWKAYVNGAEYPILTANLLFRGVELGQGRYTVVFKFQPFLHLFEKIRDKVQLN